MTPVELTIVRHGHTAANGGPAAPGAAMSGWTDTPLSPEGRRQAVALEGAPRFAALYASPLRRALDTARALARLAAGEIRIEPDLREICCGALEGWDVDEVRARHPALWARSEATAAAVLAAAAARVTDAALPAATRSAAAIEAADWLRVLRRAGAYLAAR